MGSQSNSFQLGALQQGIIAAHQQGASMQRCVANIATVRALRTRDDVYLESEELQEIMDVLKQHDTEAVQVVENIIKSATSLYNGGRHELCEGLNSLGREALHQSVNQQLSPNQTKRGLKEIINTYFDSWRVADGAKKKAEQYEEKQKEAEAKLKSHQLSQESNAHEIFKIDSDNHALIQQARINQERIVAEQKRIQEMQEQNDKEEAQKKLDEERRQKEKEFQNAQQKLQNDKQMAEAERVMIQNAINQSQTEAEGFRQRIQEENQKEADSISNLKAVEESAEALYPLGALLQEMTDAQRQEQQGEQWEQEAKQQEQMVGRCLPPKQIVASLLVNLMYSLQASLQRLNSGLLKWAKYSFFYTKDEKSLKIDRKKDNADILKGFDELKPYFNNMSQGKNKFLNKDDKFESLVKTFNFDKILDYINKYSVAGYSTTMSIGDFMDYANDQDLVTKITQSADSHTHEKKKVQVRKADKIAKVLQNQADLIKFICDYTELQCGKDGKQYGKNMANILYDIEVMIAGKEGDCSILEEKCTHWTLSNDKGLVMVNDHWEECTLQSQSSFQGPSSSAGWNLSM